MENVRKHSNKATLIAAALIITGATAIFGTYADEVETPTDQPQKGFHQELTEEQKAVLEEAKELFESGDKEGAKALLQDAGIKRPRAHHRKAKFIESLTEEQRAALEEAKALREAGDKEGAKAIIEAAGIEFPKKHRRAKFMESLTEQQQEVMKEARELFQAGDKEGAKALLEEAGIEVPKHGKRKGQRVDQDNE